MIRACCVPGRWCRSVRLNTQWCSEGDEGKVGALSMSTLTAPSISHLIIRLAGSPWRGHLEGSTLDGDDWTQSCIYSPVVQHHSITHVVPNLYVFLLWNKDEYIFKSVSVFLLFMQLKSVLFGGFTYKYILYYGSKMDCKRQWRKHSWLWVHTGFNPNKHHSNAQQFSLSNQCQAQIEGQVTSVTSLARVNPAKASHQAPAPFWALSVCEV